MQARDEQIKRAELTSSIGAGILGGGLALLLYQLIQPYAIPILALGLLTHSWGMYHKHHLQSDSETTRIWWSERAYWACWIGLAGLVIYIVVATF